ncbi:MAG: YraN family protein [Candidatus Puniceispirillaceae bacterium]
MIIWLLVHFHRILAWRWKCRAGEIDLVALRGRTICFVEVKYRHRLDVTATPSRRQQQRIIRAAEDFAKRRRISRDLEWRFDLVQVGWPSKGFPGILRQLPHAWDASPDRNTLRRP